MRASLNLNKSKEFSNLSNNSIYNTNNNNNNKTI